jgi:hypothetical protein
MRCVRQKTMLLGLLAVSACTTTIGEKDEPAKAGAGGAKAASVRAGNRAPSGGSGFVPLAGRVSNAEKGGSASAGRAGGNDSGAGGRASSAGEGSAGKGTGGPSRGPISPPCSACAEDASLECEETPSVRSGRAGAVAAKLGKAHFLIGMGNDLNNDHSMDGAYLLGPTLDLHYAYMVGLPGMGGWPDWNADGSFVNILSDSAAARCVTPMYTIYSMAAWGDGNLAGLGDAAYMSAYWSAAKLLFQRLAMFDKPAVVHVEPDFWAYATQQSNEDPSSMKVLIEDHAPDCADQPENLVGMGKCWIQLARKLAPKALIGFHASQWAGTTSEIINFFDAIGARESDIIFMDMLDRDAGCFEAAQDPNCQRQGEFYWDEKNEKSPNFHEYLRYAKEVSDALDKPIVWWQVPFGVPSDTPGGTPGHYRDNRVKYIFSHVDEFIAAGGLGATFGTGAGNQTDPNTDGGQFKDAVTRYFQGPAPL